MNRCSSKTPAYCRALASAARLDAYSALLAARQIAPHELIESLADEARELRAAAAAMLVPPPHYRR
jgi:hypothetical protein